NFIFDSENGVISAWSNAVSGTNAQAEFTSKRAVYKGLAIGSVGDKTFLYAANFHNARIDVFNDQFHRVTLSGGFEDSQIPTGFGAFGGDLLVGNFGDGAIHAYDPATGAPKGQLTNTDGNPILINGLWALRFGNGTFGAQNSLVFTAGIGDEAHGLLGEITP